MNSRPNPAWIVLPLALLAIQQAPAQEHLAGDPIVARIDGEPLLHSRFLVFLRALHGKEVLRELVDLRVLETAAERHEVTHPLEEVMREVEAWLSSTLEIRYGGDAEAFAEALRAQGRSPESLRRTRVFQGLAQRIQERLSQTLRRVDEAAIRSAWEREYGRGGRAVVVRHVFITAQTYIQQALRETGGTRPIDREEFERKAAAAIRAIHTRLMAGEDFAAVAAAESHDRQSTPMGGVLVRYAYDRFGEEFASHVASSAVGAISDPFQSRFGHHILRVDSERITPFEEVRESLKGRLLAAPPTWRERGDLFKDLFEAADPRLFGEELNGVAPGDPVARFADGTIPRRELDELMLARFGLSDVRTIAQLIMLRGEARRYAFDVKAEDLAERWKSYVQDYVERTHLGDREAALRELHLQGHDFTSLRVKRAVLDEIEVLLERLVERTRVVSPEEVKRLFERRYGRRGERVSVRHVMINPARLYSEAVQRGADPATVDRRAMEAEARKQLEALAARIRAGEDMEALARSGSHEVVAGESGGLLERYNYDAYGEEFARTVLATAAGELSQPVRSNAGWHVLRVEQRTRTPLAKVSAELRAELEKAQPSRSERRGVIDYLESTHEVELYPGRLFAPR